MKLIKLCFASPSSPVPVVWRVSKKKRKRKKKEKKKKRKTFEKKYCFSFFLVSFFFCFSPFVSLFLFHFLVSFFGLLPSTPSWLAPLVDRGVSPLAPFLVGSSPLPFVGWGSLSSPPSLFLLGSFPSPFSVWGSPLPFLVGLPLPFLVAGLPFPFWLDGLTSSFLGCGFSLLLLDWAVSPPSCWLGGLFSSFWLCRQ